MEQNVWTEILILWLVWKTISFRGCSIPANLVLMATSPSQQTNLFIPAYVSIILFRNHRSDKTGKHLRLNLKTVPMGTVSPSPGENRRLKRDRGNSQTRFNCCCSFLPAAFCPLCWCSRGADCHLPSPGFLSRSREHGADQLYPRQGDTVKINVQSLLKTLGNAISRAKFFRVFQQGDMDWVCSQSGTKTPSQRWTYPT